MLLMTVDKTDVRRINGNVNSDLKPSGELCAVKVACTVRGGVFGKVT
jgi:hypothetical protein